MQFSGRRRKVNLSSQSELYGHAVQFYAQPPLENISLNEFETFAVERLKCEAQNPFCLFDMFKPLTLILTPCFCEVHFIRFYQQKLQHRHFFRVELLFGTIPVYVQLIISGYFIPFGDKKTLFFL